MRRKASNSGLLDLSDPVVQTKLRPTVIAIAFILFFISASGILLSLPLARTGHVDFRHLYTAGYMVRAGHAADVYDYGLY